MRDWELWFYRDLEKEIGIGSLERERERFVVSVLEREIERDWG